MSKGWAFFAVLVFLMIVYLSGCTGKDEDSMCIVKCRESIACYAGKLTPSCHQCIRDCLLSLRTPTADCVNGVCG